MANLNVTTDRNDKPEGREKVAVLPTAGEIRRYTQPTHGAAFNAVMLAVGQSAHIGRTCALVDIPRVTGEELKRLIHDVRARGYQCEQWSHSQLCVRW